MKKYIRSSEMTNGLRAWLNSERVDNLMYEMDSREKRLVGKISNAKDVEAYVAGLLDACEVFGSYMSSAFDTFLTELNERMHVS